MCGLAALWRARGGSMTDRIEAYHNMAWDLPAMGPWYGLYDISSTPTQVSIQSFFNRPDTKDRMIGEKIEDRSRS